MLDLNVWLFAVCLVDRNLFVAKKTDSKSWREEVQLKMLNRDVLMTMWLVFYPAKILAIIGCSRRLLVLGIDDH